MVFLENLYCIRNSQFATIFGLHIGVGLITEVSVRQSLIISFVLQKKFEGTRTTIETFLAWKKKFDAELAEKNRLMGKVKVDTTKLTGKFGI